MILIEVKNYLRSHQEASLSDLCRRFSADEKAMEAILGVWVHKGQVREVEFPKCRSCDQCGCVPPRFFRWRG